MIRGHSARLESFIASAGWCQFPPPHTHTHFPHHYIWMTLFKQTQGWCGLYWQTFYHVLCSHLHGLSLSPSDGFTVTSTCVHSVTANYTQQRVKSIMMDFHFTFDTRILEDPISEGVFAKKMTKCEEGLKENMRQWVLMMLSVWSHGLLSHMDWGINNWRELFTSLSMRRLKEKNVCVDAY